jgi:phosphate uptake regulator
MHGDTDHDHGDMRHDWESAIRDAQVDLRHEIREAVREVHQQLRRDLDDLHERVKSLEQQIPDPLWAEKAEAANRQEWERELS